MDLVLNELRQFRDEVNTRFESIDHQLDSIRRDLRESSMQLEHHRATGNGARTDEVTLPTLGKPGAKTWAWIAGLTAMLSTAIASTIKIIFFGRL